jgi:hypothetical protein
MIDLVIEQRRRDLGGFEVGRLLPWAKRRMVGPFIFFDRMGPVDFPPGIPPSVDVRPHPHIGLATLTYLFDGEIMHRDSLGSEQPIRPGEVNWMIAGRGITHSERFERARREGGRMNGIQAWVALPREHEEDAPSFTHHGENDLPVIDEDGVWVRVIAGAALGAEAPVPVHSPFCYLHCRLAVGTVAVLPIDYPERAVYVASGTVEVDGGVYEAGRMLVLRPDAPLRIKATSPAVVMVVGGQPVGPRYIDWNFVSSAKERIAQAKADWRAGRMKLPVGDDQEFVPLPPDRDAPANPMS